MSEATKYKMRLAGMDVEMVTAYEHGKLKAKHDAITARVAELEAVCRQAKEALENHWFSGENNNDDVIAADGAIAAVLSSADGGCHEPR